MNGPRRHDPTSTQVLEDRPSHGILGEGVRLGRWTEHSNGLIHRDGDGRGGVPTGVVGVDRVGRRSLVGTRCACDRAIARVEMQAGWQCGVNRPRCNHTTTTEILEDGAGNSVLDQGVTLGSGIQDGDRFIDCDRDVRLRGPSCVVGIDPVARGGLVRSGCSCDRSIRRIERQSVRQGGMDLPCIDRTAYDHEGHRSHRRILRQHQRRVARCDARWGFVDDEDDIRCGVAARVVGIDGVCGRCKVDRW